MVFSSLSALPVPKSTFDNAGSAKRLLRIYFYSGWAFFIPYLICYLFYAWRKWPVNPPAGNAMLWGSNQPSVYSLPCLLQVYWGLHILHLVLAAIAVRSWWQKASHRKPPPRLAVPALDSILIPYTRQPPLLPLVPWVLLGRLF